MNDMLLRGRLSMPVVTGTPNLGQAPEAQRQAPQTGKQTDAPSFRELLETQISKEHGVSFSKHAASRVEQREIELSQGNLQRLGEGIRIAREKGLEDTLIIVDQSAFIVNAASGTVITAMGQNDLLGKAITNIKGTVII